MPIITTVATPATTPATATTLLLEGEKLATGMEIMKVTKGKPVFKLTQLLD